MGDGLGVADTDTVEDNIEDDATLEDSADTAEDDTATEKLDAVTLEEADEDAPGPSESAQTFTYVLEKPVEIVVTELYRVQ